jgi:hypothetical protein
LSVRPHQKRNSLFGYSTDQVDNLKTPSKDQDISPGAGVSGYVVPKGELARLPISNKGSVAMRFKRKKTSFVDDFVKQKKMVPSPQQYQ